MRDSWLVSDSKWNPPQRLLTRLDSKWKTRSFSWGERRARTFVSLQKWALRNTSRTAEEGEKKKALAAARCTACLCAAVKAQIFKPTAYNIATGCTLEGLLLPAQDTGVRIITVHSWNVNTSQHGPCWRAMKRLYCSKFGFYKRGRKFD